ncbi:MAG: hypothetical protein M1825_000993 [Sarcosagium campestre]|nr:MAG: hypothetical protein M1825_000993 [Sarcosagium campestre]
MNRHQDKAGYYAEQLDKARCNGDWEALPELIRKLKKHNQEEKVNVLTTVAQCEHAVAIHLRSRPSNATPESSSVLTQHIPRLEELIVAVEDFQLVLQAHVCLGWIRYSLNELDLNARQLPDDIASRLLAYRRESDVTGWSVVCAVKGTFIRGRSLEKTGHQEEGLAAYRSALPVLSLVSQSTASPEWRYWTEQLLAHCCAASSKIDEIEFTSDDLDPFREWAQYWKERSSGTLSPKQLGGVGAGKNHLRRHVWRAYYDTLSATLRHRLPYRPRQNAMLNLPKPETKAFLINDLCIELQDVQETYESIVISEIPFPTANEHNIEIASWVELVMENWLVLCGCIWSKENPHGFGPEYFSRAALDILYRAATKSFHSTPILRHLFTVHLALAEFDLAFKAFDTYLEIVTKSKKRVHKSGDLVPGLDDEDAMLTTISVCIQALCRCGRRADVEKATSIAKMVEQWFTDGFPEGTAEHDRGPNLKDLVTSKVSAAAHHAIGVSQAHWARLTYESTARAEIHESALSHLQEALELEEGEETSLNFVFALGLLQAETRDLEGAIQTLGRGLAQQRHESPNPDVPATRITGSRPWNHLHWRQALPLFHLLTLILSAQEDYNSAYNTSETALDQIFKPVAIPDRILSEQRNSRASEQSSITSSALEDSDKKPSTAIVAGMEHADKEAIIQLKMTQLRLLEVTEGFEVTVNSTEALLALYVRLFGEPPFGRVKPVGHGDAYERPPGSSAGTTKSKASSFITRSLMVRRHGGAAQPSSRQQGDPKRRTVGGSINAAPSIKVTDEDGTQRPTSKGHHRLASLHTSSAQPHKLHKRQGPGSVRRKKSAGSFRWKKESSRDETLDQAAQSNSNGTIDSSSNREIQDIAPQLDEEAYRPASLGINPDEVGLAVSPDLPLPSSAPSNLNTRTAQSSARRLPPILHNLDGAEQYPPTAHSTQPPTQDVRLPNSTVKSDHLPLAPAPRITRIQEEARSLAVLAEVWIFISTLYRSAALYAEAKDALEESLTVLRVLERGEVRSDAVKATISGSLTRGDVDVNELWADAWAERGHIDRARSNHFEALEHFEQALFRCPDHPEATVGLCNILLDIYTAKILLPAPNPVLRLRHSPSLPHLPGADQPPGPIGSPRFGAVTSSTGADAKPVTPSPDSDRSPVDLDRLAARDRAHNLLSSLTQLGAGWDYAEAWFALGRAYEESGQLNKAREALWWCVELEERRPVRDWKYATVRGYSL